VDCLPVVNLYAGHLPRFAEDLRIPESYVEEPTVVELWTTIPTGRNYASNRTRRTRYLL